MLLQKRLARYFAPYETHVSTEQFYTLLIMIYQNLVRISTEVDYVYGYFYSN
jgi:hypothetical protein